MKLAGSDDLVPSGEKLRNEVRGEEARGTSDENFGGGGESWHDSAERLNGNKSEWRRVLVYFKVVDVVPKYSSRLGAVEVGGHGTGPGGGKPWVIDDRTLFRGGSCRSGGIDRSYSVVHTASLCLEEWRSTCEG